MSKTIPKKVIRNFEHIMKELDSHSLLQTDESIIKGFYPIQMKKARYYGLLTENQLIFCLKKLFSTPRNFELIPFKNIKEISLNRERNKLFLIMAIMSLIYIVLPIMMYPSMLFGLSDSLSANIIIIVYWTAMIFFFLLIPQMFYRFFKGDNVIHLTVPGKEFKIQTEVRTILYSAAIIVFNISDDNLKFQGNSIDLEDLYHLLLSYTKGL